MSEPKILAVDTTFGACSAAILEGDGVRAARRVAMERGHAEALAPMVDDTMRAAGLAFADLDKLAVTTGPGTFTGQRVGLAFMRALRIALGKPLVGVTSLAAMAEQARDQTGAAIAAAIHDAKRDEVYLEIVGVPGIPAQKCTHAEAATVLQPFAGLTLAGTGASLFAALGPVVDITAPDAVWVARLAAGERPEAAPRPLYLRAPDAKLPVTPCQTR